MLKTLSKVEQMRALDKRINRVHGLEMDELSRVTVDEAAVLRLATERKRLTAEHYALLVSNRFRRS